MIALVDQDTTECAVNGIHQLSVSMIENFLVDPEVFREAIESIREKTSLDTLNAVESALDSILDDLGEHEVERRVLQTLGYRRFQPERPLADIPKQVGAFSARLASEFSEELLKQQISSARSSVDELGHSKQRREQFDGKKVLTEFFRQYLRSAGMSREIFTYYAAKRAAKRRAVKAFFDMFFQKVLPPE